MENDWPECPHGRRIDGPYREGEPCPYCAAVAKDREWTRLRGFGNPDALAEAEAFDETSGLRPTTF